jgi:hypothetical protein
MKIPRYNQSVSGINSGRSLSTGTQGTAAIAQAGASAVQAIASYAQSKIKLDARMRDLEIQTKHEDANNVTLTKESDLLFDIDSNMRTDYNNWETEWKKTMDGLATERKKTMDDYEWKTYKQQHDLDYTNGLQKLRGRTVKIKLKEAERSYGQSKVDFEKKINNATSVAEITTIFATQKTSMDSKQTLGFLGVEAYQTDMGNAMALANQKMAFLQITKHNGLSIPPVKRPTGEDATNWEELAKAAENEDVTISTVDGRKLDVNSPERQALIKYYRDKDTAQDAFFKQEKEKINLVEEKKITDGIVGMTISGVPNPALLEQIQKSTLEPATKRTLENAYSTAISNASSKTKSWNTQEGYTAQIYLDSLIYTGAIDSKEEGQKVVMSLAMKGLLDPDKVASYYERIDKNIRGRNDYRNNLVKDGIRTLVTEIGGQTAGFDADMVDLRTLDANDPESFNALMSKINGKWTIETKRAVENFYELLREGEKNGYSYNNMLGNANSSNYILNDLVTSYTDQTVKAKGTQLQSDIDEYIAQPDIFKNNGFSYRIDAEKWAGSSIRTDPTSVDVEVPAVKENESIADYIKRVDALQTTDADTDASLSLYRGMYN